MFNNKNILITGGTGSFGKKYTKILLENYKPNKIIIFSRDELKHIPIAEYTSMECIKKNINSTQNVIDSSIENKIKEIALSTDKATNLINLYGITNEKMKSFFITIEKGVNFVLENFKRMQDREIFIPNIPSIKIVDMAKTLAPDLPHKIISIKPGEKLHEIICPSGDSHLTLEFEDHYMIKPTIQFSRKRDFSFNKLKEKASSLKQGVEYNSENNTLWLTSKSF